MEVFIMLKNLWISNYLRSVNSDDIIGYFNGFCLANIYLSVILFNMFKNYLIVKTQYKSPYKYLNLNVIDYYYKGTKYLMPVIIKRGTNKFISATHIVSETEEVDITNDLKLLLGPSENFGGVVICPKDINCKQIKVVRLNEEFEHETLIFNNTDQIKL